MTSLSRGDWRPPTDADWHRLRTLLRDVILHLKGDAEQLEQARAGPARDRRRQLLD